MKSVRKQQKKRDSFLVFFFETHNLAHPLQRICTVHEEYKPKRSEKC